MLHLYKNELYNYIYVLLTIYYTIYNVHVHVCILLLNYAQLLSIVIFIVSEFIIVMQT
jgi:hypothetical protein